MTGERRCEAGCLVRPTDDDCERHQDHHWCGWCCGYYPVPHSTVAGICHSEQWATFGHVEHAFATCACRYCRIFWAQGPTIVCETFAALKGDLPRGEPVAALRSQQSALSGDAERGLREFEEGWTL